MGVVWGFWGAAPQMTGDDAEEAADEARRSTCARPVTHFKVRSAEVVGSLPSGGMPQEHCMSGQLPDRYTCLPVPTCCICTPPVIIIVAVRAGPAWRENLRWGRLRCELQRPGTSARCERAPDPGG